MILTIIVLALVWYTIGIYSFIYWWTSQFDLTGAEIPMMLAVGLLGPFAFPLGAHIHSRHEVLLPKRSNHD